MLKKAIMKAILAYLGTKKHTNMLKNSAEKIRYFEVRSKTTRIVIAKQRKAFQYE